MFTGIREISIAVRHLDSAVEGFASGLGLQPSCFNEDTRPPVQSRSASFRIGECSLALMQSTTEGSPIDRFIQKRGEGLFSVSLRVRDLAEATEQLRRRGVDFVLDRPMLFPDFIAYDGKYSLAKMNFTRPSSLNGVLFEVQEFSES